MIIDELNNLLNDYNYKKDILDNHTSEIVKGIKEWCLNENKRIDDEMNSILQFFRDNISKFASLMTIKNYCGDGYYRGFDMELKWEKNVNNIVSIELDSTFAYKNEIGFNWTKLPKPIKHFNGNYRIDVNRTDLDYWTDCRRYLAIRNEVLSALARKTKDLVGTMILRQKERCDEMMKAVKDIEKDETETISFEIKVEFRKY